MTNRLYIGDNLDILRGLDSGTVDLIYLDPPFNSKRIYHGTSSAAKAKFSDVWEWDEEVKKHTLELLVADYPNLADYIRTVRRIHSGGMAGYLLFMTHRLIELHRVLKPTGSLYLHCDPTASHYLKVVLDRIFGAGNFRNEIVWHYNKWTNVSAHFQKNHDCIFFYAKDTNLFNFNKIYDEPSERQLQLRKSGYNTGSNKQGRIVRIYDRDNPKVKDKMLSGEWDGAKIYYVDGELKGKFMSDVWPLAALNGQARERTGWATQKPLALLRRIISASSNEGDLILDPFAGCGTATIAAEQLGRRWIGCDIDEECPSMMRLLRDKVGLSLTEGYTVHKDAPPRRADLTYISVAKFRKGDGFLEMYGRQRGNCNGCGKHKPIEDMTVDHIIARNKGGPDCVENYQLLCGVCNTTKGDKPMEYLLKKLEILHDAKLRTEF